MTLIDVKPDQIDSAAHGGATRDSAWPLTLAKLALTALAIGVIAYSVDLSSAWQRAAKQDLRLVSVAPLAMLLQIGPHG
jgi:hypothetical protein